jgi:hypothetical protein
MRRAQVGVRCVRLEGSMSMEARERMIAAFTHDPSVTVFLMSLKAGGVALNLTAASHVMLMDPWCARALGFFYIGACMRACWGSQQCCIAQPDRCVARHAHGPLVRAAAGFFPIAPWVVRGPRMFQKGACALGDCSTGACI